MKSHASWVEAEEKRLEKKLLEEYSEEQIQKHLQFLTGFFRRAGTEGESRAAAYIRDRLDEYRIESELCEFDAYISHPGSAELEVISPLQNAFPALPRTFIPSTPPEGVEAELVSLGKGLAEDYRKTDVRGKVVLARLGGIEDRVEAARLAQEKGALAQVFITVGRLRAISVGQARYTWGSPTPETLHHVPKIPALSICKEDGEYLLELLRESPVTVRVKADASTGYERVKFPVATLPGRREKEQFVLVGGHYCSWFTGAADNAAANALMLEMARVLSAEKRNLDRSVRFAWWTGHEQGTYAGSTWYLDHHWDDLRDHGIAYLVLDGIGRIGSSGFEIKNTEEIRTFQETVVREVLGLDVRSKRVPRTGDQSFWGIGIPSFLGRTAFEGKRSHSDVEPGWYDHTVEDILDKVDLSLLPVHFRAHLVSILRLCNNSILPFEFVTMAEEFRRGFIELELASGSLFDLTSLMNEAERLRKNTEALNRTIQKCHASLRKTGAGKGASSKSEAIDACLIRLSRILLPVLSTEAGKYGQDPMGMRLRPFPRLDPLRTLATMDAKTEECRALVTSLVRERNQLSDALNEANGMIENTMGRI